MNSELERLYKQILRIKELKRIVEDLKASKRDVCNSDGPATAIILETRKHMALSFVVRNVLENLDPNWSVRIFHGNLNEEFVSELLQTELFDLRDRITLKNLGVDNLETEKEYSKILMNGKFTEEIPTEIFLIFQTNSMINPKGRDLIKKFLNYDYVGAPWKNGGVGHGGFSLRRRSRMMAIINSVPVNNKIDYEDILFSMGSARVKPWKPSSEEAREFCLEAVYSEKFFGIHQPWECFKDNINDLFLLCPGLETLISLQGVFK